MRRSKPRVSPTRPTFNSEPSVRSRSKFLLPVVALLVMAQLLVVPIALGQASHFTPTSGYENSAQVVVSEVTEGTAGASAIDVALVADHLGTTIEEAESVLALQDAQSRRLDEWVGENRSNYGGAEFGRGGDAGALTIFVKSVDAIGSPQFPGPVQWQEVAVNLDEQHAALDEATGGRAGVDATINPSTGVVTTRTGPLEDQLGCDNDGRAEAGRFGAARSYTNKPYDEISSYSGCSDGQYDLCSTGFAVHQGSQHGVLTAGHCGDQDPAKYLSISYADPGPLQIQSMSIVDRDTWNTNYWHDYSFHRERYENTRVYGLIYKYGQNWMDVTGQTGVFPLWTIVCSKLGATAFFNSHQTATKCGEIVDSSDGGFSKADSNFFRVDWFGSGCDSTPGPGDSGSPVYRVSGDDAIAYGIVTHGDCTYSYQEKITSIRANGSLSMHYSAEGTG